MTMEYAMSQTDYSSTEGIDNALKKALNSGEAGNVAECLGLIARAKGIDEVSIATGMSVKALYSTLSNRGNPKLSVLLKIADSLGLKIQVKTRKSS